MEGLEFLVCELILMATLHRYFASCFSCSRGIYVRECKEKVLVSQGISVVEKALRSLILTDQSLGSPKYPTFFEKFSCSLYQVP